MMSPTGDEELNGVIASKHGRHNRDVGQMRPAVVRIVLYKDIAAIDGLVTTDHDFYC